MSTKAKTLPADTRQAMLGFIKHKGSATAGEVAVHMRITREGARQQLQQLESEGWITRSSRPRAERAGRPAVVFQITPAGDHLFPKNYDTLSLSLVDAVADQLGPEALEKLLTALTDQQVKQWEPKLAGKSLPERIKALKGIYDVDDAFTSVKKDARGYVLVERNCPFLNVALKRPHLCSVTVSTLIRLLGVHVVREERFQDGDRRCVFRVLEEEPVDTLNFRFALESEPQQAA
ncbi:MAG TPA: DNA-binding protein [Gammaproteobacteria bacterium]|jgi:predicted ArsR family transcriptional regulator|nr:DNA-binding protein [Gammaproteobacteria bacterium]